MKLTAKSVATLTAPVGKSDAFIWDDDLPGFGIRVRGKTRRWVIQYRISRQQRRESLGDIRRISLDDARKIARQRFASVELGVDPQDAKAKATPRLTFAAVAERYLDYKKPLLRPSTYAAAKHHFAVQWSPFATRAIESIRRADVAARLQEISKAHGRISAGRSRANLSALFSWAMGEGLVEANPTIATNDPGAGAVSRDRVLDPREIKRIWDACDDNDFGVIVRLLLLSGQRRNEIAELHWSEIDLDSAVITLPAARTKNKRQHVVPLSSAALSILKARPRVRDLVFGAGDRGFTTWSHAKHALEAAIGKLPAWTLHDLRRTTATGMADLDIQPHVIEAVLNHTSGSKRGVAGIYNRATYEREKRQAVDRWASHLEAIVEGRATNITPLRREA
jgi:integrase